MASKYYFDSKVSIIGMIYYLGVILQMMFLLSGLAIIVKGFVKSDRDNHFDSIMVVSGLFGTILICLSKVSNLGYETMSYMSLALGVLALVSAFVANFIERCEAKRIFGLLVLFFLSHAPINIWKNFRVI